jgi:multiple sugar transport system ATP-binding protein
MAEVTFEHVVKTFQDDEGEIVAVDDLNLEIEDGEFLVLVGPSGCGKSTTLRMVAGLETPTSGKIMLGEEDITNLSPQQRDIAMVFQSYALYPHMTVRENMAFGLEESTELSEEEISQNLEQTASMLDIEPLLKREPGELSGGQQQRVALGRSIVRDPEVFLLDEPLANLDAKLRAQMRTELQKLQKDLETTTIYVTHDQTEAMTMPDRLAVLNDGCLQQVGTPLECYHKPNNTFVAGFLGEPSMNFYDGKVEETSFVADEFTYELPTEILEELGETRNVRFGIRPEDIEITQTSEGNHEFPAIIDVIEPQGNENTVHLRFRDKAEDADELTVTIDGMRSFDQGQNVSVKLPSDAIHLFNADTGQALHNRSLAEIDTDSQSGLFY